MNKYKVTLLITIISIIALSIGIYTYAWFTITTNLNLDGTEFSGLNETVITIGDEVFSMSPMGDYMGQTSLDFYEYVLFDDLEFTYILDDEENNVTRDFLGYNITIAPYTVYVGESQITKIVNEHHAIIGDTRTEIDLADPLDPIINIYDTSDETLYASTEDGDEITVDGIDTTVKKNGSLITRNLTGSYMTETILHGSGYYTIIDENATPDSYVIYNSSDEVVYDSDTIAGSITFDESGDYPNVLVSLEANELSYIGINKTIVGVGDIIEIIYNNDGTTLHKVNKSGTLYYILYNSMSMILYSEETDDVDISVEEVQLTAYAIQGDDYEEAAYYTTKSFDLDVTMQGMETRDLNVVPIIIGIVPLYTTESPNLDTMDGVTTGTIYYTTVTTEEDTIKYFGLSATTELVGNIETIRVNNYDNLAYTLKTNTYVEYDSVEHGDLYFTTTLGYTIYYASAGYPELTAYQLTHEDPSNFRVNINGDMVVYNLATHGTIQYSTITLDNNYQLYYYEYDELEEINNFIEATPEQVGDGINLCICTSEILVYNIDDTLLHEQTELVAITFRTATIYNLPAERFLEDFYWEITLAEYDGEVLGEEITYHPDENGSFVDENEVKLEISENTLYSCVLNLYFANGYTFRNVHSDAELTYTYNVSRGRYEVNDTGELTEFSFCDESYIGSHFLIKITIGSNVY